MTDEQKATDLAGRYGTLRAKVTGAVAAWASGDEAAIRKAMLELAMTEARLWPGIIEIVRPAEQG